MRDRKGWKALGYESFKEYGEKELGYQEAYVYRLVDAAEISLQLGYSPDSPIGESPKETHLRPLKSVPEDERKAIWDEAVRKAEEEGAKLTAKRIDEAVEEWKAKSESERQRREAAEKALHAVGIESTESRLKIRELSQQIDLLKAAEKPEPVVVEKAPADYETTKQQAAKLRDQLASLKKKQDELIQQQVVAKLREREKELADLDRKAQDAEARLRSLNKQIDSYSSIERMTRLQRDQIEKTRSMLAELAANMEGFDRLLNDPKTDSLWAALADMLRNGAAVIEFFRGATTPLARVGEAA